MYYSEGKGGTGAFPPVVLVHGAGGNHLCWPAEMRRLKDFTVFAVDLPGHGRSNGIGQQTIGAYSNALADFLAELGIYQAVLVGHSMGGAVALQVALEWPGRVLGLGLISTGASLEVPTELIENLSNPISMHAGIDWLKRRLFTPHARPALVKQFLQPLEDARPGVLYGDWLACARFDVRSQIPRIRQIPVWVAVGDQDRITPLSNSHFLANQLECLSLQVIPGASHAMILEQPKAMTDGLVNFLNRLAVRV
jgi:pimeloyl-ACP methyl ester carboxylesterase